MVQGRPEVVQGGPETVQGGPEAVHGQPEVVHCWSKVLQIGASLWKSTYKINDASLYKPLGQFVEKSFMSILYGVHI